MKVQVLLLLLLPLLLNVNHVGATFYEDCDYGGYAVSLVAGKYTKTQLQTLGIKDDDISSLKAISGYQIILYADDNYTGTALTITTDNSCLVGNSFNDITTSIEVVKINNSPSVAITAPSNNATYTAPANITISATASDSDGSITKVEFYNGNTLLSTSTASPYSYNWTNVAAGTYSLTVKAFDDAGAITTSGAISVKVNAPNQPPTVSITAPANNANYTAPASIGITASASDSDGSISKVEFYNGSNLLSTSTSSPYTYSWTNVAVGTYTITAKAFDNTGATTTSGAITVKVNAPNQAPTVLITAPANNASYTAPASISITASASDSDGSISKVEFYNGSTLLSSSTSSPYAYSWTNIAVGTYTISAKAFDNSGATTISGAITVKVNAPNQAPTVSITAPADNVTYTAPASISITASASDSDGSISKVEFYNGSNLLSSSTSSPYTYSWTNVAAGTYTITAKAFDNAGATTTSGAITVKVNAPNQAPTVSITAPANNASYTAPASINITASATDSDGSIAKVEFYNGSTLLSTNTTSPYTYNWTNVVAGTYTITAVAYDNSGATTTSAAVSINVNSNNAVATVYQHCNYEGYSIGLAVGNYTISQLIALGVIDNDLSSVKVQSGYQIVLFADDNFLGNSLVITSDNACVVSNSFNDITTSIKVSAVPVNNTPTVSISSLLIMQFSLHQPQLA